MSASLGGSHPRSTHMHVLQGTHSLGPALSPVVLLGVSVLLRPACALPRTACPKLQIVPWFATQACPLLFMQKMPYLWAR